MADKSLPMIFVTAGVVIAGLIGYGIINQGGETVDTVATPIEETSQSAVVDESGTDSQNPSTETQSEKVENGQEAEEVDTASLGTEETSQTSEEDIEKPEVKPVIPTYDILRIEPDGSAVIAGQAAPNSEVALLDGDDVIANTKAGSGGDFAIILDKPLSAGLHQLTLQTTDEDGKITESEQQGIVEVPAEGSSDEPTVLVSKPGEATRVLQKPELAEDEKPKSVDTAKLEETSDSEAQTPQTDENTSAASTENNESASDNVVSATDSASVDLAKPEQETTESAQTEITANQSQGDEATTGFGGTVTIGETAEATTEPENQETAALAKPEEETSASAESEVSETTDEAVPVPTQAPKVEETAEPEKQLAPVLLEAADIEGDKIFIAGTGEPGMIANIYLDSEFLGQTQISGNGAFLFEGNKNISAGRYDVRADMVESGSSKVVARAEVSLLHEPEPEITPQPVQTADVNADVATSEETGTVAEEPENAEAQAETATAAVVEEEAVAEQTDQASTTPKAVDNEETNETATGLATINQPTQKLTETNEPTEQLAAITEDKIQLPEQDEAVSDTDQNTNGSINANNEASAVEPAQDDAAADGSTTEEPSTNQVTNSSGEDEQSQTETAGSVEIETPASDQSTTTELASLSNDNGQTTSDANSAETSEKKELRTGTAVIIRRGDSLWRVARRNYGKGIRYTTIFEANRDQVRDADLIYPGQVLKVPELEEEAASE